MASRGLITVNKALSTLHQSSKCITVQVRRQSCWTSERVILSPYKDIEIPNCTLYDYVWQNLDRWPERTAAVCASTGRGYTYEQAFKLSNAFAANLRKKFKITDGDTVTVMLPNIPDFPLVALGILEAGGVISTINPVYTAHEIQRQLVMSKSKLIVTLPELATTVKEALKLAKLDLKIIVVKTNGQTTPDGTVLFNELSEDTTVDKSCLKEVRRDAKDLCFLPYSSGTTGLPKGVELTNRNLVANCEQVSIPELINNKETTASHQCAVMSVLPFFHIFGASVVMFHKMSHGCKLVTMPKFSPKAFLEALERTKTNILFAAPPIVLLMTAQGSPSLLRHLQAIVSGAAPLSNTDVEQFFNTARRKLDFRQGYGLSETSPTVTLDQRDTTDYGTVGHAVPNTQLRIVDQDGKNLGAGETGELLIRGPQVMAGYHQDPESSAAAFSGEWFRSGDQARVGENGAVVIADRLKELIKVKGFQVPPAELEAVLREHPAVNDAAVVGIPHPTNGESPKAFVVLKKGHKAQAKDICEFVKERVASYKRIDDVMFLETIPKSAAGKILRRELKASYC